MIELAIRNNAIDHLVFLTHINGYSVILLVDGFSAVLMHRLIGLAVNDRIPFEL